MRFIFLFLIFLFNYQYLGAVEFLGKFEQGSFILGKTKPNSKVKIDNKKIRVSKDGFFAFGLDRDRKNNVVIVIKEDGKTKTIEKQILKRKSGSIINISSIFGLVAGQKRSVYSMTKFGVEGLTKGMALDLAKYNIRVNSVCPNIVLTPRTKKYFADKKYNKYVKDNTPINKVVTVSDVATSITFLASEAASMITGTSIVIDGGWTAK